MSRKDLAYQSLLQKGPGFGLEYMGLEFISELYQHLPALRRLPKHIRSFILNNTHLTNSTSKFPFRTLNQYLVRVRLRSAVVCLNFKPFCILSM